MTVREQRRPIPYTLNPMSRPVVTRFAPSPTGSMHLGNVRTALFSWLLARATAGRFVLRVEDTDPERSREEFLASQMADLRWLGIEWDAGPDREDDLGPYRQSRRGELYEAHYARLVGIGATYPCYCSAAELEVSRRTQVAAGRPPRYAGTCRELTASERARHEAAGRRPALRFRVPAGEVVEFDDLVRGPQSFAAADIGDFVVRRADGAPVFFFCNALDDALMGITHVLRGEDHLANTPRQLMLLRALGLEPPAYGHQPLLLATDGVPLSKRTGSTAVAELRERGFLAGAVCNYLLRLGHTGAPDGWLEPATLPAHFDAGRLGRAPAHYDESQLTYWQREAVKRLGEAALEAWMTPALPAGLAADRRRVLARLLSHNVVFPGDALPWVDVLFGELPPPCAADAGTLAEAGPGFFAEALAAFDACGADLAALGRELRRRTGRKGAALYMPLRIALTGRGDGPELAPLLKALPPATLRARLAARARGTA